MLASGSFLNLRALSTALSGYVILVAVILVVQLIPPIRSFLGQAVIHFEFPEVATSMGYVTPAGPGREILIFRHTGTILTYASTLAYFVYRGSGLYKPGAARSIITGTARRVWSSTLGILAMVAMAVVMEEAGMTEALALGLAKSVGFVFPLAAPWIGAVGAFITGSNTNSNLIFSRLQMRTAGVLGLNLAVILAAQTTGAALASVIAPTKVVVGVSTAGMIGQEGLVMRKMFAYTGLLLILISTLTAAGAIFGWDF
jgi:lactate permease